MRLSILLFFIYQVLWIASRVNTRFKAFIRKAKVRLMIKTADGRHARLFVFDQGRVSTATGPDHDFDAALVWQDPGTAVSVMLKRSQEAVFYAAAEGKLKVEGMSVYALWFDEAVKQAM
ncbi:hypothetical protein [Desulfosudis oleivorans]|uniref:SCP2 domain-containing protein n=1 Tax=Desulfosudis oleivorans (strain DSM 6200 / JCM 39069 / Hxd3) TaxID=96561 RepID=A8ZYM4_DESOH|nr:hypothetical protein [Desulfosudis oleivorans]ABW67129.1 hypothetical protein Dole_1325 [Desulfosudis oleivorans Hxd3]